MGMPQMSIEEHLPGNKFEDGNGLDFDGPSNAIDSKFANEEE
jgi:hypothetical protein